MKIVIDVGHAGTAFGHYLQAGKQSSEVPPGIYEGEFNREVGELVRDNFPYPQALVLTPGPVNMPLKDRVLAINKIAKLEKVCVISIHANASPLPGWSSASGFKVFVKKKPSPQSFELGQSIEKALFAGGLPYPGRPMGFKGFYMLRKVRAPICLAECGFMTNPGDAAYMASSVGKEEIAAAIAAGLYRYLWAVR